MLGQLTDKKLELAAGAAVRQKQANAVKASAKAAANKEKPMKVQDLRAALKEKGLNSKGRKADLVLRLKEAETEKKSENSSSGAAVRCNIRPSIQP